MYGPELTGDKAALDWVNVDGSAMTPRARDKFGRNAASGRENRTTTVVASGASIAVTLRKPLAWGPGTDLIRSIVALTAAASTGLPLLNFMPSRKVRVSVRPSAPYFHAVAAFGCSVPAGSVRRSVS